MPIAVVCESCKTKLKVPDALAGKKVKCPKCKAATAVPAAAPAPASGAAPFAFNAAAAPTSPHLPAWKPVATGLKLSLIAFWIAASLWFPVAVCALIGSLSGETGFYGLAALFGMPMALGLVLLWIGHCYCCMAPQESGVRPVALGALLGLTAMPVLFPVSIVLSMLLPRSMEDDVMMAPQVVALFVSNVFFALMLRKIAAFFGDEELVRDTRRFFITWLAATVVLIFGLPFLGLVVMAVLHYALLMTPSDAAGTAAVLVFLAGCIACFFIMARLLRVTAETRALVRGAVEGPDEGDA